MNPDLTQAGPVAARKVLRVDESRLRVPLPSLNLPKPRIGDWPVLVLAVMATGFVLAGAANLDLSTADARLGLAAGEPLGPLGQICGSWAPDLWPAKVAACRIGALFEPGGRTAPGAVLWPAALSAVAIGWILSRRITAVMGRRAGLLVGLCWFSCLGVIDHSGATGLDMLSGLAIVAAVDRLLTSGSDWQSGLLGRVCRPGRGLATRRPDLSGRHRHGPPWGKLFRKPDRAAARRFHHLVGLDHVCRLDRSLGGGAGLAIHGPSGLVIDPVTFGSWLALLPVCSPLLLASGS